MNVSLKMHFERKTLIENFICWIYFVVDFAWKLNFNVSLKIKIINYKSQDILIKVILLD